MFLTRSEYDRGVNTFSPEGRLFQVEYAIEAIKLGSTAIGIRTNNSVVLAAEKRITSPLMIPKTVEKIVEIDKHIGCTTSGLMADSRTLIERARVECQQHWFVYNEPMSVESCAMAVSELAIKFGDSDNDSAMSRPFGVAMLFAGFTDHKPQLWHMDPSGTYTEYNAKAIGSGSEGAQQELQERYTEDINTDDAINLSLSTLKGIMEKTLDSTNVEVMVMARPEDPTDKISPLFKMLTKEDLETRIAEMARN